MVLSIKYTHPFASCLVLQTSVVMSIEYNSDDFLIKAIVWNPLVQIHSTINMW